MSLSELLTLQAGALRLRVWPQVGGAMVDLMRGEVSVLRPLGPDALERRNANLLGGFPLLPYSNRIAQGRFSWAGRSYQLDHNFGQHPHTIHGVGWRSQWQVASAAADQARLTLDYDPAEAALYTWPFRLHAELLYALDPHGLHVTLSVRNDDAIAWPAGLGLHPYFPRTPDLRLGFRAREVWVTEDSLPVRPEPIPAGWRFDPPRPPDGPPLDNCFTGWDGQARLDWPSLGHAVTVAADPVFDHLLVFTPPEQPFCAVEPVSHLPDAINRLPGEAGYGLRLLAPGETLSAGIRLGIEETA